MKHFLKKYKNIFVAAIIFMLVGLFVGNITSGAININVSNKGVIDYDKIDFKNVFVELAKKTSPAVVNISASFVEEVGGLSNIPDAFKEDPFFQQFSQMFGDKAPTKQQVTSLGSGFIISADGFIVTNNHVVAKATKSIKVILQDGRSFDAVLYAKDEKTDLAVLKINATNLPTIVFGDSDNMRVGDWVIAIGNPFGLGGSVTQGIISARGRNINLGAYDDFVQTDASINQGNSGGPMINLRGEVIGVNTAIFSPNGGSIGIGFAVPSNRVLPIVKQLIDKKKVTRGWTGVTLFPIDEETSKILKLPSTGVMVTNVLPNSPANKAGIEVGDVIIKFNDKLLSQNNSLSRYVAETEPGKVVEFTIIRKEKEIKLKVTLGTFPDSVDLQNSILTKKSGKASSPTTITIKDFGAKVAIMNPDLAANFGFDSSAKGLLIVAVEQNSIATSNGLVSGILIETINLKPATVDELNKAVAAKKPVVLGLAKGNDRGLKTIQMSLE